MLLSVLFVLSVILSFIFMTRCSFLFVLSFFNPPDLILVPLFFFCPPERSEGSPDLKEGNG